jgi:hypothetical protein
MEDVRRFVQRAMSRFDAALDQSANGIVRAHLDALPEAVKERLAARGLEGSLRIAFTEPAPAGAEAVTRSQPLPATLAEALLEGSLDPQSAPIPPLGRTGAWPTAAVKAMTTVAILRLRYKLTVRSGRGERLLLAEEAGALAWEGTSPDIRFTAEAARALLEHPASGDLASVARNRQVEQALKRVTSALDTSIADYARGRAASLADDHARVRAAALRSARVSIEAVLPPDVMGVYVLVPGGV